MKTGLKILLFTFLCGQLGAQEDRGTLNDTLMFRGMASAWSFINPANRLPFYIGGRYIPQLNYHVRLPEKSLIDFEGSVNLSGQTGLSRTEQSYDGNVSPYRLWARYSTSQFETRIGLQKINFGSAMMLRPLMWFDQVDPRDPLQLTNGVWALLSRYYFLNNTNIWFWAVHGSNKPRTWEISPSNARFPELGGRIQTPIKSGEAGLSYHFRMADTRLLGIPDPEVPENRLAFDAKWDLLIGLWVEAAWIHKSGNSGMFGNQQIATLGADYTFGIGNGLNLVGEQFVMSFGNEPFTLQQYVTLSAASLSYPLGMFDNITALVYYEWKNHNAYNFINWKHQFRTMYLYVMAYWNPENSLLPQQQTSQANLFGGRGVQVMLVYNH